MVHRPIAEANQNPLPDAALKGPDLVETPIQQYCEETYKQESWHCSAEREIIIQNV